MLHFSIFGQIISIIDSIETFTAEVQFYTLNLPNAGISLDIDTTIYSISKSTNRIKNVETALIDADLVLEANLIPTKRNEMYKFNLELDNTFPTNKSLNDTGEQKPKKRKLGSNSILNWKNALEKEIYPEETYTLTYYVHLLDTFSINCAKPPSFKPYRYAYIGGVAFGTGLMLYSQEVTKPKVQENYDLAEEAATDYINLWEEGILLDDATVDLARDTNAHFLRLAKTWNDKQKSQLKDGRNIVIASVLTYAVHYWFIYRRKKKQYDKHKGKCPQKVIINPIINTNAFNSNEMQLGLNLTYNF